MPNASDFNRFTVNPVNLDMNRSMFNMDHSVKWSANIGECIPFECVEILPGDTVQIDTTKVIRLQPLVAPIFEEIVLDTYYFFVPNRLVWSHWKEFMGENNQSAWAPTVEYSIPTLAPPRIDPEGTTATDPRRCWNVGTIADFLGVPVGSIKNGNLTYYANAEVNALPFRAYALICDQWFRSESVMDPVHVFVDDTNREGSNGSDQVTDIELGGKPFIACKFFDYFTSVLPSPQRGDPVRITLLNDTTDRYLPVIADDYTGVPHPYQAGESPRSSMKYILRNKDTGRLFNYGGTNDLNITGQTNTRIGVKGNNTATNTSYDLMFNNLYADAKELTNGLANYVTINDLRTAFAVQRYLEKQARFGGRYIEFIKGFFGVDSPDARLQRSEYLGGSRVSLNISQVEQTSATTSNSTPLGNVAGMSVTADQNSDVDKSFTEHGYLIGIAVARYHHCYQDSLHPMWTRKDPLEFYNPTFANLGEQKVTKQSIWAYDSYKSSVAKKAFGYQEAWSEYKFMPSRVCSELRSVYETPLDMWHLGDHYESCPTLSPEWLREDKSNLDRCLAVTSDVSNQMICDFYIDMKMTRVMPMYSIPGLIDHH